MKRPFYALLLAFSLPLATAVLPVAAQTPPAEAAADTERSSTSAESQPLFPELRVYFGEPNPASFSFYGPARLQLPSLRFDVGSSLSSGQLLQDALSLQAGFSTLVTQLGASQPLDADTAAGLQLTLGRVLGQFENGARLDYDLDYTLFGFGGTPLTQLQIAGRPLALGLHLGSSGRGYLEARFSEGFNQNVIGLSTALPGLLASGATLSGLAGEAGTLVTQINQLNQGLDTLVNQINTFAANPFQDTQGQIQRFNQTLGTVNDDLQALVPTARELTGVVSDTTGNSRLVIDSVQSLSDGGLQLTSANDLHVTLGVSAAYPVYESPDIKVSLGTRLKLFMLPYNAPLRDFDVQTDAGLLGKLELQQVRGFEDTSALEGVLNRFDNATTDVNQVIDRAERLSAQVDAVSADLSANRLNQVVSDSGQALVNEANQFNQTLNAARGSVQQAAGGLSNIQQLLLNELQDIAVEGLLTTPSGAGFGMDFGVDAQLFDHLRLGLMLQNPLVLWQGTERPFSGSLQRGPGGNLALSPTLTVDDAAARSVNYTATVPFSVLLSGRYRFDALLPNFQGLYGHSLVEVVTNGRQPAWVLGLQKYFADYFYVGAGGRVGGVGHLFYLEGGLNPVPSGSPLSGFGLDLQLGFSPTGSGLPLDGLSWLGMSRLGLSYRF